MLLLIVAAGPDKGRVYELPDDQTFVVGREGGDVRLSDRKSSRRHCRLWSEGGRWYLRDLGSRHGTYCNRQRVDKPQPISDGDHLQIGSTVLVVSRLSPEQAERLEGFDLSGEPVALRRKRQRVMVAAGGAAVAAVLVLGSSPAWLPMIRSDAPATDPELVKRFDDFGRQLADIQAQGQAAQTAAASQADTGRSLLAGIDSLQQAASRSASRDDLLADSLDANLRQGAQLTSALEQTSADHRQLLARLDQQVEADHRVLAELAVANEQNVAHQRRLALLEHELRHLPKRMSPAVAEALAPAIARLRSDPASAAQVSAVDLALVGEHRQTRAALADTAGALDAAALDTNVASQAQRLAEDASARLSVLAADRPSESLDPDDVAEVLREVLAAHAESQQAALDRALAPMQPEPMADRIAERLQAALAEDAERATAPLLAEVRALAERIDASPSRDQIVADIAAVLRHDGRHQQDAVERLIVAIDGAGLSNPDGAWARALENAVTSDQRKVEALLSEVLREVRLRPDATEFAELREAIEAQPARVQAAAEAALAQLESRMPGDDLAVILAAIADVKAALPPDLSEPLQAAVTRLSRIEAQTRAAAALHQAVVELASAGDGPALARLDDLEAGLLSLPDNAPAPTSAMADLARQLDDALGHDHVVTALRELESRLTKLRRDADMPGADAKRLAQLQSVVEQQRVVAAELVELRGAVTANEAATRDQALEVLHALQRASASSTRETLEAQLDDLRSRVASREEIRSIVDQALVARDLRGERAMAMSVELGPSGARDDADEAPREPATVVSATRRPTSPGGGGVETGLTPLQRAYWRAFESGRTITYADPRSKRGAAERVLDPGAAREAGHQTWRQWYAADLEAERQALRELAQRQRDRDASAGNHLIGLPEVRPTPRR